MKKSIIISGLLALFIAFSFSQESVDSLVRNLTESREQQLIDSTENKTTIRESEKHLLILSDTLGDSIQVNSFLSAQVDPIASVKITTTNEPQAKQNIPWALTVLSTLIIVGLILFLSRQNRNQVKQQLQESHLVLKAESSGVFREVMDKLDGSLSSIHDRIKEFRASDEEWEVALYNEEKVAWDKLFGQVNQVLTNQTEVARLLTEQQDSQTHFITPYPVNEKLETLGERLAYETSKEVAEDFTGMVNQIKSNRDQMVSEIQALNSQALENENNVINHSLSRLNKYRALLESIAQLTIERYELATKNKVAIEAQGQAMSDVEKNERKERIKFLEMIGGKLLTRLTDSGLVRPFQDEAGELFDNKRHAPVAKEVDSTDPTKNLTIFKSYAPGLKMGDQILVRQPVQLFRIAQGSANSQQSF